MRIVSQALRAMITCAVVLVGVFALSASAEAAICTHYASPSGGENGSSQSSPFQIANFWSVAGPGKVLCLLDGTYTGANSMIDPPDGLSGQSGSPVTVRALNDGKVLIDGQFARVPVRLTGNSWWVIEGVNAAHSNDTVVLIGGGSTVTTDNVLRRVIAWDGNPDCNCHTVSTWNATRTIFEDIAAFGVGRYNFVDFGSTGTVVRRAWTRWERNNNIGGPQMSVLMNYHATDNIFENILSTWNTQSGLSPNNTYAILGANGSNNDEYYNDKLFGSIAYLKGGEKFDAATLVLGQASNGIIFKDVVAYAAPEFSGKNSFELSGSGGGGVDLFGNSLTAIGGTGINSSRWTLTNTEQGATVASVSSIYTGTTGATVCKRYVNGMLTSEPLWPWPMNQRIIDAMVQAGKTPVDVTATIESLFGKIPAECRSDGTTPVPTVSLSASPSTITSGQSSTLMWSSTNVTSCTGTNFSTGGLTSGNVSVSPTVTTIYSLSCTGTGGTGIANATVTVNTTSPSNVSDGTILPLGPGATPFNLLTTGTYKLIGSVTAPDTGTNSFWIDMDSDPTNDDTRTWDLALTSTPQNQNVTWRGANSATCSDQTCAQYNPKTFTLAAGVHTLNIVTRESGSLIQSIQFVKSSTSKSADLNNDGIVNSLDWSIMNSQWGTAGPDADLDNDGIVNSFDWFIMNGRWGTGG